jgi:hypothetical protein
MKVVSNEIDDNMMELEETFDERLFFYDGIRI